MEILPFSSDTSHIQKHFWKNAFLQLKASKIVLWYFCRWKTFIIGFIIGITSFVVTHSRQTAELAVWQCLHFKSRHIQNMGAGFEDKSYTLCGAAIAEGNGFVKQNSPTH